jgi:tetratricopeptide (TPR) repeat protein
MSASSVVPSGQPSPIVDSSRQWMISPLADCCFILLTPLLAAPIVLTLGSSEVGVQATTISLVVTSLFALGHHLPGLMRAYGDQSLFQRFRWRFVLVPPLVFLAYFPLSMYHLDLLRLVIMVWATWHGLMQIYGFVRIYDSKVGSASRLTANLDWMVCFCGFIAPQLYRPDIVSTSFDHWHSIGGPVVSAGFLSTARWVFLTFSTAVLVAFALNYAAQSFRGPKPNPLKLLMLMSGIGTWSLAMTFVDELILAVALSDICHDLQYNAIVWMYNCRLARSDSQPDGFIKFLFRRRMVLVYAGLITAYGALGLLAPLVESKAISDIAYGFIFTSTILHYYYDGFIWKVRETDTQANLGLSQNTATLRSIKLGNYTHLLKWSPAIVVFGGLLFLDFVDPPLTTARKQEIEQKYSEGLMGKTALPETDEEISWLYTRFETVQQIAKSVPDDRKAQLRSAIMLANFGRNDEAVDALNKLLQQHPDYYDAHMILGEIHFYRAEFDRSSAHLLAALSTAETRQQRAIANSRLGEIDLEKNDTVSAKARFEAAAKDDPEAGSSIERLKKRVSSPSLYP